MSLGPPRLPQPNDPYAASVYQELDRTNQEVDNRTLHRINNINAAHDLDSDVYASTLRLTGPVTVPAGKVNVPIHVSPTWVITQGTSGNSSSYRGIGWDVPIPAMTKYDDNYALIGTIRPGLIGYSSTSITIGAGSKTFTVAQGLPVLTAGANVQIASLADPTNYMRGSVTSYSGTTLVVNVASTGGAGTHADWYIGNTDARGTVKGVYIRGVAAPGFGLGALAAGDPAVLVPVVIAGESQATLTNIWLVEMAGQGPVPGGAAEAMYVRVQGDSTNPWHQFCYVDATALFDSAVFMREQPASNGGVFLWQRMSDLSDGFKADASGNARAKNLSVAPDGTVSSETGGKLNVWSTSSDTYLGDTGAVKWILSGGNLYCATDGGGTIGAVGALRPSEVHTSGKIAIGGDLKHEGANAGFFNTAPTTKPTVTGSRGGNAALASLLTGLAGLGLIVDSSS